MLSNVLDLPEGQNLSFSDVADDAWYNKAVSAMATRETAAGMLYAMMDSLHMLWQ